MEQSAIQVRNLSKSYDSGSIRSWALREVDLEVKRGELVLLMGPSGSGKTTLLSAIGCILRPTSGSVRLDGLDVWNLPSHTLPSVRLKRIGFVFQAFNLFPALTAGENVALALDIGGVRGAAARRRADEMLANVGLQDKFDKLSSDLSGGQKQRVAIARALVLDPTVILADEPTAALDSETGASVMGLLRSLARQRGRAVVVVTHDSRMVTYADRVISIEDGLVKSDVAPACAGQSDRGKELPYG
jgi:putative ABC transport system ATP-binding protein